VPYLDELALDIKVAEDAEIEKQKEKDEKDLESHRELQRILKTQHDVPVHSYIKV
jgi:hypothetical protein